jgi:hypothetical protein
MSGSGTVQDASAKNEPATNAGHSETAAVFRVTNESPRPYPGEMGGAVEGAVNMIEMFDG